MGPGTIVTLDHVYRAIIEVKVVSDSMDARLKMLNGMVREHEKDLAVLKDWRASQANKAIGQVGDLRVELARAGVMAGSFGLVITVGASILKGLGVF